MPAERRFASHRLCIGLLVGVCWVAAVEYFFGYALARNENQDESARLLVIAGSCVAVGGLLLLGELLVSRARGRRAALPAAEQKSFPAFVAPSRPDFEQFVAGNRRGSLRGTGCEFPRADR